MPPSVPYCIIPLTQGQVAFVSPRVYAEVIRFKWHARLARNTGTFYAVAHSKTVNGKRTYLYMHRLIMGLAPAVTTEVDHREAKDTLNNTDLNLRPCSKEQQAQNKKLRKDNTTGFKGVTKVWHSSTYRAKISAFLVRYHLGSFRTPEEAARAYDRGAIKHHADFAVLNFPRTDYEPGGIAYLESEAGR